MGFNPAAPGRGISGGNIPNWGFDLSIFSWIHKLSFFCLVWFAFCCCGGCLFGCLFLFVCFVCSVVDV
jgi:hypothetical protein